MDASISYGVVENSGAAVYCIPLLFEPTRVSGGSSVKYDRTECSSTSALVLFTVKCYKKNEMVVTEYCNRTVRTKRARSKHLYM